MRVLTVDEIGSWGLRGTVLDSSGIPAQPLHLVDVSRPAGVSQVERAVAAVSASLPLAVGIAAHGIEPGLQPLVAALTCTLLPAGVGRPGRESLSVPDPTQAGHDLIAAAAASPRAAVILGQLLRQTELLQPRAGLAAEAAAYSMLLGGAEFRRWLHGRTHTPPPECAGSPVGVVRDRGVLKITLHRPARRNAVNVALREALIDALMVAVADKRLSVELSGIGPAFCSGGDLDEFGTTTNHVDAYFVRLDRNPGWLIHQLRERMHVRVHGASIGAGAELAAFAGSIIATPDAFFSLPEVGMGLLPGAGGTVSITHRIGRWRTAWLALTGSRLDARTALQWGLIDQVADEAGPRS